MRVDREGVLFESPGVPPHYIIGRIRSTQQTASYCLVFKRICLANNLTSLLIVQCGALWHIRLFIRYKGRAVGLQEKREIDGDRKK